MAHVHNMCIYAYVSMCTYGQLTWDGTHLSYACVQGWIQDYGKGGHKAIEYARSNARAAARGVWGHAPPQEIFEFLTF